MWSTYRVDRFGVAAHAVCDEGRCHKQHRLKDENAEVSQARVTEDGVCDIAGSGADDAP